MPWIFKESLLISVSTLDLLGVYIVFTWKGMICGAQFWFSTARSCCGFAAGPPYDGYDKSKPVLPRWPHHLEGLSPDTSPPPRGRNYGNQAGFQNRTHISVSAILAHGYGCIVYLSEEGNVAGGTFSSLTIAWDFISSNLVRCVSSILQLPSMHRRFTRSK